MKHRIILLLFPFLLIFSGCQLIDKAKKELERVKHKYEEYKGTADTRGSRPFTVTFQQNEADKTPIITSQCSSNADVGFVHFMTQTEAAGRYFSATANLYSYPFSEVLKPFWDFRYTNPVSRYLYNGDGTHFANHSVLTGIDARTGNRNTIIGSDFSQIDPSGVVGESKCVNGALAAGTTLNLYDAPEQALTYSGIGSTFTYQIRPSTHIMPWKSDGTGNLMLQGSFDLPIYHNYESNIGGGVSFNVFLYNPKINKHLNFVIGIYAYGSAWQEERAGIRFDPTTGIVHVATVAKDDSWWCTKSPKSRSIQEVTNTPNKSTADDGQWNDFYRVNIAYQNIRAVLAALQDNPPPEVAGQNFGLNPEDWEVTLIAIQYELEEQGGKASISGSFRGFEAYLSRLPL